MFGFGFSLQIVLHVLVNLWNKVLGKHTFTCALVFRGLFPGLNRPQSQRRRTCTWCVSIILMMWLLVLHVAVSILMVAAADEHASHRLVQEYLVEREVIVGGYLESGIVQAAVLEQDRPANRK